MIGSEFYSSEWLASILWIRQESERLLTLRAMQSTLTAVFRCRVPELRVEAGRAEVVKTRQSLVILQFSASNALSETRPISRTLTRRASVYLLRRQQRSAKWRMPLRNKFISETLPDVANICCSYRMIPMVPTQQVVTEIQNGCYSAISSRTIPKPDRIFLSHLFTMLQLFPCLLVSNRNFLYVHEVINQ